VTIARQTKFKGRAWHKKPPTTMAIEQAPANPMDFSRLSEAQLVTFGELIEAATGEALGEGTQGAGVIEAQAIEACVE
jgi:hypothetical protein